MYEETDAEFKALKRPTFKKVKDALLRGVTDVAGNVKRDLIKEGGELGKEAVMHHNLIKGSSSKAMADFDGARKVIYKDLSKAEVKELDRIIQSRRTIEIDKYKTDVKHTRGLGGDAHAEYLKSLHKETLDKLNKRADEYFKEMESQLTQLYNEGLLTKESYDALKGKEYSPRKFIQHIDPDFTYEYGGKKVTVSESGIKRLDKGSEEVLMNDSSLLLSEVISRTQNRIFKNRANQSLHKMATELPDNAIIKLPKVKGEKPPSGYETINVMIDGKPQSMFMPRELAVEWVGMTPEIKAQTANFIGWISGSKLLKPMATGLNPEFAITNLPRDIAYTYLTTGEYSKHLPKFIKDMGKDLKTVTKDAFTKTGRYKDYINEGGGMEFLTHQGLGGKKSPLGKIGEIMGYLGETSEIIVRLALRERAIRNGKTPTEATAIARGYLDFSQGGQWTKGADTAIPYLNASIQGSRGILRAMRNDPAGFATKVSYIGGTATALWLANNSVNKEAYDEVPDYQKVNNWIITTPYKYRDEEGNIRHLYFSIPKDQGQKVFASGFDALMEKHHYGKIPTEQVMDSFKEFIPVSGGSLIPPTIDAFLGYASNHDFWRDEEIWKGGKGIKESEEYNPDTHQIFVKAGEVTGKSPVRMERFLEQYATSGNLWTMLVGGGFNLIFDGLPEGEKEKAIEQILTEKPFIRKILKSTSPYKKDKETEDIIIEGKTERYKQNREMDILSEKIYTKKKDKKDVIKFIKSKPVKDRERLQERFINYVKVRDIPDRYWWLNVAGQSPEVRAQIFWTKFRNADSERKKEMLKIGKSIDGFYSERFKNHLKSLNKKDLKNK